MKLSHMVLMTGLIGLAACSGDERDIRLHELRLGLAKAALV